MANSSPLNSKRSPNSAASSASLNIVATPSGMGQSSVMMETSLPMTSAQTPASRLNAAMASSPQQKNAMERSSPRSSKEEISRPVCSANRISAVIG
jgi:hypothetical protein